MGTGSSARLGSAGEPSCAGVGSNGPTVVAPAIERHGRRLHMGRRGLLGDVGPTTSTTGVPTRNLHRPIKIRRCMSQLPGQRGIGWKAFMPTRERVNPTAGATWSNGKYTICNLPPVRKRVDVPCDSGCIRSMTAHNGGASVHVIPQVRTNLMQNLRARAPTDLLREDTWRASEWFTKPDWRSLIIIQL